MVTLAQACDECGQPAVQHGVEIVDGVTRERHLCDAHAADPKAPGASSKPVPMAEWVAAYIKRLPPETRWPVRYVLGLPSPRAEAACALCGAPPVCAFFDIQSTGVYSVPVELCAAHADVMGVESPGKFTGVPRRHPAKCDACDRAATIHRVERGPRGFVRVLACCEQHLPAGTN
jgi:hypothetical protein